MDSKIMGLINAEVAKLPRRHRKQRYRQYEAGKKKLCQMFPGGAEHEYICKAVSKKYGV
jgi:hypothetical protein